MSDPTAEDEVDADADVGAHRAQKRSRGLVGGMVAVAVVVGGYFALGMPGMDHTEPSASNPGMDHGDAEMGWTRQGVVEFAGTVDRPDVVTVNVHVPDEGSIAGTDLTIPYTDVLDDPALPTDRTTPLALYCRSGRMSTIAAQQLADAGYTNITELDGGMNAWADSGRPLGT